MATDYATLTEARAYGYQSDDDDDPVLSAILTRASRLFDQVCGLPAGYFDKCVTTTAASARKFWGNGTNYLKVDPFLSTLTPTVAMGNSLDTPTFLQVTPQAHAQQATTNGEFFLVRTYGDDEARFEGLMTLGQDGPFFPLDLVNTSGLFAGWPEGLRVTVTAKWGWDSIPSEVVEAVLEMTISIWRGKDAAFARVVNLGESQQIFGALPDRAKLIAEKYRVGKMVFA